jgi:integrase
LTPTLIARYVASRPATNSAHTLKGELSIIRLLCSYAEAQRYVMISPFRLRSMQRWVRPGPPIAQRHATRQEIKAVLELMRKDIEARKGWAQWRARRLYAVTATIAYTGLRAYSEALRLYADDLDFDRGMINLVPHGKSKRFKTAMSAQPVPMPPALVPILKDWLAHRLDAPKGYPMPKECPHLFPTCARKGPWIYGSPTSRAIARLKSVAARAGILDMTFHMLRRSWATHAEYFGVPPGLIQRVLRHTRAETTVTHYRKADTANLSESVQKFEF